MSTALRPTPGDSKQTTRDPNGVAKATAIVAVGLAATVPYLAIVDSYFILDDFGVVQLLSQKPFSYFPKWFVTPWTENIWGFTTDEIRPFPALTFQIGSMWGAASPAANHAINLIFHTLNALLVFAAARLIAGLSVWTAMYTGILFAVFPFHAEAVSWISARTDLMPACFYLGSFLAYARWRAGAGSKPFYAGSLILFFLALFSKQYSITMAVMLLLYDVVVERRAIRLTWSSLAPYLPYVVLTAAYLALRYFLLGQFARESMLSAHGLANATLWMARHVERLILGDVTHDLRWGLGGAVCVGVTIWLFAHGAAARHHPRSARLLVFFGPVWWLVQTAPLMVAGYESPRHIYLASVSWAVVFGLAIDTFLRSPRLLGRVLTVAGSVGLLIVYVVQLQAAVTGWSRRASVSQKVTVDLEREALAAPAGSLLIVNAPSESWEWALPFAAQPPFTRTDLTQHVLIVSPMLVDCCRWQWHTRTRSALQTWLARPGSGQIVALTWDAQTGQLARLTDRDDPDLRHRVMALLDTPTLATLDRGILRIRAAHHQERR